jgi:hypothetical protein
MPTARYIDSLKNPRIPGFEWQEPENDADRQLYRDILDHGAVAVRGNSNDDYAFSIGLYLNFLHPEIIVMGLSRDVSNRALYRILGEAEKGRILAKGDERSDLFELRFPVRFVPVDEKFYFDYIQYAAWFYRSLLFRVEPVAVHMFPVLQAIWADKNGFYPDDPHCDATARRVQTLVEITTPPQWRISCHAPNLVNPVNPV